MSWAPPAVGACPFCGGVGGLQAVEVPRTELRRVKFGVFWVLVSLVSFGLGLILYLVFPRKRVEVGVDRYVQCGTCGARR
jgi:hypothetical protein